MNRPHFSSWEDAVKWLLAQPDQTDLIHACYYDQPLLMAAERYYHSDEWRAVKDEIKTQVKGNALDIGAGNGIVSYALAKDGWNVTALEPDPSNLVGAGAIRKLATDGGVSIRISQDFGENLSEPDSVYNLVIARQVLHHARNLKLLCKELHRVLKPGGTLVAIREHVISRKRDLDKFYNRHPLHHLYGGEHAYMLHDYLDALRLAGFTVRKVIKPLESVINYAPQTREDLRSLLKTAISRVPAGNYFGNILNSDQILTYTLRMASLFDRRPGRLYSFICLKPE
jgi:2-polyprenyl-3-methyl-5-hydroxy-6-metoxy-1,4-benzoquinol methylase